MRLLGKSMLFFSSYSILFLILLISEFTKLTSPILFTWEYILSNLPTVISVGFYFFCIAAAVYSLVMFRKNYKFGTLSAKRTLNIASISNGTSEVISYLLTMVIPLISSETLSSIITTNQWIKLVIMLIIIVTLLLLYFNSNLIVINPMLIIFGYSIYKIDYYIDTNKDTSIEGVLLSDHSFDPETMAHTLIVDKIDKGIYLRRRV